VPSNTFAIQGVVEIIIVKRIHMVGCCVLSGALALVSVGPSVDRSGLHVASPLPLCFIDVVVSKEVLFIRGPIVLDPGLPLLPLGLNKRKRLDNSLTIHTCTA
jgi:hypothetical protein